MSQPGSSAFSFLQSTGNSKSSILGVLAAAAIIGGYFLPWVSGSAFVENALGASAKEIARFASHQEEARDAGDRLKRGDAISGADWSTLMDAAVKSGDLKKGQIERLQIASATVRFLPYVAGALAILLLILSLPAGPAGRVGGLPATAVLRVVQSRLFAGILMPVVMLLGLIVFSTMAVLFGAAKMADTDPGRTGYGILLMLGGSAAALLSGFLGFGPGRFKALLVAALVFLALIAAIAVRVS